MNMTKINARIVNDASVRTRFKFLYQKDGWT